MQSDLHEGKKEQVRGLKTPLESSHNQDEAERRMVILVRLLARNAAEKDFKEWHRPQGQKYLH